MDLPDKTKAAIARVTKNPAKAGIKHIKVSEITEGERFRKDYDKAALKTLKESIEAKGLIQPITVSHDNRLVAGGRRLSAIRELGWDTVPCIVRQTDDIDLREVELIENTCRKDMSWQETAALVEEIHNLYRAKENVWTLEQTGRACHYSVTYVSDLVAIRKASNRWPEILEAGTVKEALKFLQAKASDMMKADSARIMENVAKETSSELGLASPVAPRSEMREREQEKEETPLDRLKLSAAKLYRVADTIEALNDLAELYSKQESAIQIIDCDPPYGIDLHNKKKHLDDASQAETDEHYSEVPEDQYREWLELLAERLYKVAAKDCWLIMWCDIRKVSLVQQVLDEANWVVNPLPGIWVKEGTGGQCQNPDIHLASLFETFVLARKGRVSLTKKARSNVFSFKVVPPQRKYHPAQKPVELMEELFMTLGTNGGLALVPFLGSGASLIAASRVGITAFGFDLSTTYRDRFLHEVFNLEEGGNK